MNEAETRAELIDPALTAAGWGVVGDSRIRREEILSKGRLEGAGKRAKGQIADYVLIYKNTKLAVIEAKKRDAHVSEGLGQAKHYAQKLMTRFAISTNGLAHYQTDMTTGIEGPLAGFPSPDALWALTFASQNAWSERFAAIPFENNGGLWEARYYQHNASSRVLDSIATGQKRILLTLATGTGKTSIAFQLAWKLFQAKWNISGEPTRRPRILFLADRNVLATQAYNSFTSFPDDALVRISPEDVSKKGQVPKNGSVFFTIFQTLMSGTDADGQPAPNFEQYPPDFFDLIIIDECHRGGAKDESSWRGILQYFAPATQLGLTATPKRKDNVDTYAYFGEPVYTYSLKQGIEDGYLTPFKVKQIATTLDDYVYTPDDDVVSGEVAQGKRYIEGDFNRTIEIEEREAYRIELLLSQIDQREKTLVFCANQGHALAIRDLINQKATNKDPLYCVRVTANDLAIGDMHLKTFCDNEKTIPTILTTSQKLSTGVDAKNVRNIVLLRPVKSMIEFKQIIGRGTRIYDGKDYFTIYDFVKAYEHFNDPEWDGEPAEVEEIGVKSASAVKEEEKVEEDRISSDKEPVVKLVIKLADDKARTIQHMMATSFWDASGSPISAAQFIEKLFGELPEFFKNEDELRALWQKPDTRKKLLEGLEEKGFGRQQLTDIAAMIHAGQSDLYDVLAYVAHGTAPMTRRERVDLHIGQIHQGYGGNLQGFLDFVLGRYVASGVGELEPDKLPDLIKLRYETVNDGEKALGNLASIREAFTGFQRFLYAASPQ